MNSMDCRFMGMTAYNPDLPTTLFRDGALTLQFGYYRHHIPCNIDSTNKRVGVVIVHYGTKIYLYTDEKSNLFGDKSSNTCVGKLLITRNSTWNGMVSLNIPYVQVVFPFAIVD